MNPSLAWLLDVPQELRGEAWRLTLSHAWPTWALAVSVIVLALAAWWCYLGLRGPRPWRAVLAGLRFVSLALVLLLVLGPAIEWPRERQERDLVQVLVDRSASMQVKDMPGVDGARVSRDQVARTAVTDSAWKTVANDHDVAWMGMTGRATAMGDANSLPPADGRRTLLAESMRQAMRDAAGRPVAAIVLVTDGRSQDQPDATLLRALSTSGVRVLPVALGDPRGAADRAIVQVEHPSRAFPKDRVPVQVTVAGGSEGEVRVALQDRATGRALDERQVRLDGDHRGQITLTGQRGEAGDADWEVTLLPEGQDADPSNDKRAVRVSFVDRPLRVLFVDGWPRWEFRYLRNLLLREEGFESSVMLLSADRDFAQEGTSPLARLPANESEFAAFDVIMVGDVPGSFLDAARQRAIVELVARRGAGLLWIGGERATPSSWHGHPMEDLLPMRNGAEIGRWDEPVLMKPTPIADRLGLLGLGEGEETWPRELSRPGATWAQLQWAQRIDVKDLKPTVEAWAMAEPARSGAVGGAEQAMRPLVLSMRFGSGSVAYVGTDETWRWRHGRGETLPERFWIQIIRHLARQALRGASEKPSIEVEPSLVAVDQPARISVEAAGQPKERVVAEARRADGAQVVEIELRPDGKGRLAAAWAPPHEGAWTIRLPGAGVDDGHLQARSEDPEMVETLPDHDALRQLAEATGGRVLKPTDLADLPSLIPSRSITVRQPLQWPLWQRWPLYALLATMLAAEWLGRRALRLA